MSGAQDQPVTGKTPGEKNILQIAHNKSSYTCDCCTLGFLGFFLFFNGTMKTVDFNLFFARPFLNWLKWVDECVHFQGSFNAGNCRSNCCESAHLMLLPLIEQALSRTPNRCFATLSWGGSAVFILPKLETRIKGLKRHVCWFQRTCVLFHRGQRLRHYSSTSGWREFQRVPDARSNGWGPGEAAAQGRHADVQRVRQEQIYVRRSLSTPTKSSWNESSFSLATFGFWHKGAFCFYLFWSRKITQLIYF